ncbi:hypothetical protein Q3G72_031321 [Acer saccharum]|nr:hypothetical protein Q3G72_031321 [Acer saccharum]
MSDEQLTKWNFLRSLYLRGDCEDKESGIGLKFRLNPDLNGIVIKDQNTLGTQFMKIMKKNNVKAPRQVGITVSDEQLTKWNFLRSLYLRGDCEDKESGIGLKFRLNLDLNGIVMKDQNTLDTQFMKIVIYEDSEEEQCQGGDCEDKESGIGLKFRLNPDLNGIEMKDQNTLDTQFMKIVKKNNVKDFRNQNITREVFREKHLSKNPCRVLSVDPTPRQVGIAMSDEQLTKWNFLRSLYLRGDCEDKESGIGLKFRLNHDLNGIMKQIFKVLNFRQFTREVFREKHLSKNPCRVLSVDPAPRQVGIAMSDEQLTKWNFLRSLYLRGDCEDKESGIGLKFRLNPDLNGIVMKDQNILGTQFMKIMKKNNVKAPRQVGIAVSDEQLTKWNFLRSLYLRGDCEDKESGIGLKFRLNPDLNGIVMKDQNTLGTQFMKIVKKNNVKGMRTIIWSITHAHLPRSQVFPSIHGTHQQVLVLSSSNLPEPQAFKGMREDEVWKASRVLKSGVHCLALFKEKDEREMLHLFS